ncbi:hypothetical protein, partial [Pseudomonas urmiensis]
VTRIVANGQITVKRLTDWLNVTQPLPVSGDLPYQLQLILDSKDSPLVINSTLKGVAIDLPAPFGKTAEQERPSEFRMTLQ